MEIDGKVALVTGGGRGIGAALSRALAAAGARGVVVADVEEEAAAAVAQEVGGLAVTVDVAREEEVQALAAAAREAYGRVDLLVSNAGILGEGGVETPNEEWQRMWEVNFMAHIYLARAFLPEMLERGDGAFLLTASAAGLLSQIGSAPYAVTKHATVALAEWLAFTYAHRGLEVFCLCPLGVRTRMLDDHLETSPLARYLEDGALAADEVARATIEGLSAKRFLILPHPEVEELRQRKGSDYDRWLAGMSRLERRLSGEDDA